MIDQLITTNWLSYPDNKRKEVIASFKQIGGRLEVKWWWVQWMRRGFKELRPIQQQKQRNWSINCLEFYRPNRSPTTDRWVWWFWGNHVYVTLHPHDDTLQFKAKMGWWCDWKGRPSSHWFFCVTTTTTRRAYMTLIGGSREEDTSQVDKCNILVNWHTWETETHPSIGKAEDHDHDGRPHDHWGLDMKGQGMYSLVKITPFVFCPELARRHSDNPLFESREWILDRSPILVKRAIQTRPAKKSAGFWRTKAPHTSRLTRPPALSRNWASLSQWLVISSLSVNPPYTWVSFM